MLNLGKYERQYWTGVTFGDKKDKSRAEQVWYEYLAFMLKLYGAQPISGMAHLHGKKGKAMVHIGAVDAPVTVEEINAALDECVRVGQKELHVLGWEWEMGLAGPNNDVRRGGLMHEIARQRGVKLVLLQVPREVMEEQAVEKGDVKFFELAYFEAEIKRNERTVQVELKDFASPNMDELIPEEIRAKINKWSDYIDYWAIDWDFQNDTFMQGWVAYRTRGNRKLPLVSDPHTYEKPGRYRIVVKVIDIFGNDTSQAYDVEV
ncbi:MAG: adenine-specific DNA methylase [Candidatus Tectimicrobiota bacterium]|nr:MAG: adenine-specific DNA methylase [Candidatus Tectomicrobia bacterium]